MSPVDTNQTNSGTQLTPMLSPSGLFILAMDNSDFISTEQISTVHSYITEMKFEAFIAEIGRLRQGHIPRFFWFWEFVESGKIPLEGWMAGTEGKVEKERKLNCYLFGRARKENIGQGDRKWPNKAHLFNPF